MGSFRRLAPVVLFATNFLISPLLAQQSTPVPRPLIIMDLFAFRDLHDPQISPDGKWLAAGLYNGTVSIYDCASYSQVLGPLVAFEPYQPATTTAERETAVGGRQSAVGSKQ